MPGSLVEGHNHCETAQADSGYDRDGPRADGPGGKVFLNSEFENSVGLEPRIKE